MAPKQSIGQLAHWLKDAGGTVGFDEFTESASAVQEAAATPDRTAMRALIDQLKKLVDAVQAPGTDAEPAESGDMR